MLSQLRNYFVVRPFFFSILRKIIELNFRKQKKIIQKAFAEMRGKRILDIGCGTGEFSRLFDPSNYFGLDISPIYIAYAREKTMGNFQVMDATKISFPDNSFDGVLIMAILHHLSNEDVEKVLREAGRVLKSGGRMLIMEDAKIPGINTPLVNFLQSLDKGGFIRSPEDYKNLILPHFSGLLEETSFRNGGCVYYSLLLKK